MFFFFGFSVFSGKKCFFGFSGHKWFLVGSVFLVFSGIFPFFSWKKWFFSVFSGKKWFFSGFSGKKWV